MESLTAWKVSVCGAILVRIFPRSDSIWRDTPYLSVFIRMRGKIRTRITPNRDTLCSVILAQKISNTFFFPRAFLCHNCQNNAQCVRLVPIIFTNSPTRLDKNTKKCCQEQTLTSIAKEKLCDKKMEESFLINRWCHAHFPILHKI